MTTPFRTTQQILNLCYNEAENALRMTNNLARKFSGTTTDNTPTELYEAGTTDSQYVLDTNTVASFNLNFAGFDSVSGDALTYTIKGGIKNVAGTVSLISGSIDKSGVKDDANWDVDVLADNVNKALKIQVTGDAVNPVAWTVSGIIISTDI